MKLEFLPDGSDDCPLVRLYDFSAVEVVSLVTAISGLADGTTTTCLVHELMGVEPVSACRLLLRVWSLDLGMVRLPGPAAFGCVLTPDTWLNVVGLVEPFVAGGSGFQWLSTGGDARWLLSGDGRW
jgi:hypothetical protein